MTIPYYSNTYYNNTINSILSNPTSVETKKERENNMFKFDFGPINTSTVHMSPYGLAIKNKTGTWVSYDSKSNSVMDVEVFNFPMNKFLYKMPVSIKDIKRGDIIIHMQIPMFVESIDEDNKMNVIDIFNGENKNIMPTKSPFGFNFYTKVINLMDMCGGMSATSDAPFGNMWMLAALGDNENDNLLPMVLMMQNKNFNNSFNPMMMYMLMQDKDNKNIFPLMLMMQNENFPSFSANKAEKTSN